MIRQISFAIILVISLAGFFLSARRLIRTLRIGRKEDRFDKPTARLKNVLSVAFGQSKLLREPVAPGATLSAALIPLDSVPVHTSGCRAEVLYAEVAAPAAAK